MWPFALGREESRTDTVLVRDGVHHGSLGLVVRARLCGYVYGVTSHLGGTWRGACHDSILSRNRVSIESGTVQSKRHWVYTTVRGRTVLTAVGSSFSPSQSSIRTSHPSVLLRTCCRHSAPSPPWPARSPRMSFEPHPRTPPNAYSASRCPFRETHQPQLASSGMDLHRSSYRPGESDRGLGGKPQEFLVQRRRLMAAIMRDCFQAL